MDDIELERHKLLEILVKQLRKWKNENQGHFHIEFDELLNIMDCDRDKLDTISAPLMEEKIIAEYRRSDGNGLCVNDKGESVWATGKYKDMFSEKKRQEIKDEIDSKTLFWLRYKIHSMVGSTFLGAILGIIGTLILKDCQ